MNATSGGFRFRLAQPLSVPLDKGYATRQKRRIAITYCVSLAFVAVAMLFVPAAPPFGVVLLSAGFAIVMFYLMVLSNIRELNRCGLHIGDDAFAVRSLDRFDWFPFSHDSVLVVEAGSPADTHWKVYAEHDPEKFVRVRRDEHPNLIMDLREAASE